MCEHSGEYRLVRRREGGEGNEKKEGGSSWHRKWKKVDGWMGVHGRRERQGQERAQSAATPD